MRQTLRSVGRWSFILSFIGRYNVNTNFDYNVNNHLLKNLLNMLCYMVANRAILIVSFERTCYFFVIWNLVRQFILDLILNNVRNMSIQNQMIYLTNVTPRLMKII